jgi:hypothetical protein
MGIFSAGGAGGADGAGVVTVDVAGAAKKEISDIN